MRICSLFAGIEPDPVAIALEYLALCRAHPDTATPQTVQAHVRHIIEHQWSVLRFPSPSRSGRAELTES